MISQEHSRQHGIYYTTLFNPFGTVAFQSWVAKHQLQQTKVLEPFAGANSIIDMLQDIGMAKEFAAYDLFPQSPHVNPRDTLNDFPSGHTLAITNPPWLYKSSARRRGLAFPSTEYNDLYKLALARMLEHTPYVAALVPASFVQSGLFRSRLDSVMMINTLLFEQTEMPTCLAMFGSPNSDDFAVHTHDRFVGTYRDLQDDLPAQPRGEIRFNDPQGKLGLIAIDNQRAPSIRFCHGGELKAYQIKVSSRSITRISLGNTNPTDAFIAQLNESLFAMRARTDDVLLTPFKGLRHDGKYRRRIDFALARRLINACICSKNQL